MPKEFYHVSHLNDAVELNRILDAISRRLNHIDASGDDVTFSNQKLVNLKPGVNPSDGIRLDQTFLLSNLIEVILAGSGKIVVTDNGDDTINIDVNEVYINHNILDKLDTSDVHTQYLYLSGRSGGQEINNTGGLIIGDGTNYVEIQEDGTLRLYGTATVFEDLQGSALSLEQKGPGLTTDDAENTIVFATNSNLSDYAYSNYQLKHHWKIGSSIYPHIHFEQTEDDVPNFLIQYRWQVQGSPKTTSWTNLICNTLAFTYASGTLNQIALSAPIVPPSGAGISDVVEIRILRDNANTSTEFVGADTFSTAVHITFVDIHIEKDSLGSDTEYSK